MDLGKHMERELREQPAALALNSQRYLSEAKHVLGERKFQMVLLAARGSSDNAALYARYLIEVFWRIPVSLAAPSVLTKYGTKVEYPATLAIGISQSGAAPDVSEVLGYMRSMGHATLAITNTHRSRLSETAEHTIELGVGPEQSVAATKTYSATLLALYQIVRAVSDRLGDPELPTDSFVDQALSASGLAVGPVVRSRTVFSLARGYSFASAHETALKLMECALLPCKAYSTSDFEHGPKALASHGTAAIVFGETPSGLPESGCEIVPVPVVAQPECQPFFDAIFAQSLALNCARSRGLDPDAPKNLTKVTETL